MDHSHISSRPCSSFFDSQSHNPIPFGSSSLSTASPFSSSFGSTSSDTLQSTSFHSPFNTNVPSSQFTSPTASSSFFTNQSPNTSTFIATSTFTDASPNLSPFASNSTNNSPSGTNNNSTTPRSSSPTSRMKYWKARDNGKSSPHNQLRARRDEVVARFRGIDLSEGNDDNDDFYVSLEDPGANDPAWTWDAMCNKELNSNSSEPKQETPWYVVDPNLSWEEFLYYCNQDRIASGKQFHPRPVLENEQMLDPDDDRIDDKDVDPWAETKSEIIIEPLINISDPNTMLCPYCKQYSLQKVSPIKLECSNCGHPHIVRSTTTVLMLKHRMIEYVNAHKVNCSSNFSDYTLGEGNIILICKSCDRSYNISGDFK